MSLFGNYNIKEDSGRADCLCQCRGEEVTADCLCQCRGEEVTADCLCQCRGEEVTTLLNNPKFVPDLNERMAEDIEYARPLYYAEFYENKEENCSCGCEKEECNCKCTEENCSCGCEKEEISNNISQDEINIAILTSLVRIEKALEKILNN